ncbi:alpha/beta hydrolase [Actinocrispum sp. NPDC049592]|uniref:alpha/beta hydrolase n=1 Tax=Actinocrispum sp. NPDC049592 TaxID=3154835 RepID=UPI00341BEC1C
MTYAIDPELRPWLDMLPAGDLNTYEDLVRARAERASMEFPVYTPEHELAVRDTMAGDVPVRIYSRAGRDEPRPGFVHIHGGGFVMGTIDWSDAACMERADKLDIVVVSVDYRLAPEHPYPIPVEDCYAALTWTASNAAELGIDPDRLGVGGDSAGGGLTAGTVLLARDRGGPAISFQYLGIPELDDRLDTPSMTEFVDTPLWNRPRAVFSWESYLGDLKPGGEDVPVYAAPSRATDLSGLPPAVVTACQFDPLRDEDIIYAQRLMQAGVLVELRHYPGTFHGCGMIREAGVVKRMNADYLEDLRRGLKA